MRFWVISSLFLALPIFLPSIALSWPGEVVEVIDADILRVRKDNTEVDVRLYGIDAPESDQPYGLRAIRFTKMMARFERVEVEPEHRDQHGRAEALVYLDGDGECLNEELVRRVTPGSMSAIATSGIALNGRSSSAELDKLEEGSGHSQIQSRHGIGEAESRTVPSSQCPGVKVSD